MNGGWEKNKRRRNEEIGERGGARVNAEATGRHAQRGADNFWSYVDQCVFLFNFTNSDKYFKTASLFFCLWQREKFVFIDDLSEIKLQLSRK